MTLRGEPVEVAATLPDGREVVVRVGVPEDSYVAKRERATVDVELLEQGRGLAAVTTLLEPEQTSEARELARAIASRLEDGSIEPTAGAIEPLVELPRRV
jgi:hypothetical protein